MHQKLLLLAEAATSRLPTHLADLDSDHVFLIPAILDGKPRIYSIILERDENDSYAMRSTEHRSEANKNNYTQPFLVLTGSGASTISKSRQCWVLRQLSKYDANMRTADEIAFALQWLNICAYNALGKNGSVGQRSIVMWRDVSGGGHHRYFRGSSWDKKPSPTSIPMIAAGGDVTALGNILLKFAPSLEDIMSGNFESVRAANQEASDTAIAKIPCDPDDSLPKK